MKAIDFYVLAKTEYNIMRFLLFTIALPCAIIFGGIITIAFGQHTNNTIFQNITIEDGLASNTVNDILELPSGYMLFGTSNGLNIYDGYSMQLYKEGQKSNLLPSHNITALELDIYNLVWIGTTDGIIRITQNGRIYDRYSLERDAPYQIPNNYILEIYRDSKGYMWCGTARGMCRYNPRTDVFKIFDIHGPDSTEQARYQVYDFCEDDEGCIWVATNHGLYCLEPENGAVTSFHHDPQNDNSISSNAVRSLAMDALNNLWIGTGNGLDYFNPQKNVFKHYKADDPENHSLTNNHIDKIFIDRDGQVWLGTQWGINRLVSEKEKFDQFVPDPTDPQSLAGHNIVDIFQDHSGTMWFGSYQSGASKHVALSEKFFYSNPNKKYLLQEFPNRDFLTICHHKNDTYWAGTYSGLFLWDRKNNAFELIDSADKGPYPVRGNNVRTLYKDSNSNLWIGSYIGEESGITRYDPRSGKVIHYSSENQQHKIPYQQITAIVEDKEGYIWLGTEGRGLIRLDPETDKITWIRADYEGITNTHLSGDWIFSLYKDSHGRIWTGTDAGLNQYHYESQSFTSYKSDPQDSTTLSDNRINCIYEDKDNYLWIGTEKGLSRFDPDTHRFKNYFSSDGLASDQIRGIQQDEKGFLWISTAQGLARFDPVTSSFVNFTRSDGIKVKDFNSNVCITAPDGDLIFGGLNGFIHFDPEEFNKFSNTRPVVLTSFKTHYKTLYNGLELTVIDTFRLGYQDNSLQFEFALLNYAKPEKNQYAYKLEGFDKDWVQSGKRRYAGYTNLAPGTYNFYAKARNSYGIWSDSILTAQVQITAPFWQKTGFFFSVAGTFVLLLLVGYQIRVKRLNKRRVELETLVHQRTREIKQQSMELERSKERYRLLYNHAPVGYFELDDKGKILDLNDTNTEMLGYALQEMHNHSYFDFVNPDEREEAKANLNRILEKNETGNVERHLICKNGQERLFNINYRVVWNELIGKRTVHCALQDVTELYQLEEQLRQTQKMEAIGRLAGGVAHDFNNILTIIRGYCALLVAKLTDPSLKQRVEQIDKASERAETLTRQLLAFSRKQQLQPRSVNINLLIKNIQTLLVPLLGEDIRLDVSCPEEPGWIHVDPNQFENAIMNLATNAKDAMPNGGSLKLEVNYLSFTESYVSEKMSLDPGDYISVAIRDTGEGMDAEALDHLFEPFYTTKPKGKGTGLGLSMVYGFVKQSKGNLEVHSTKAEGTSFFLYFPRIDKAEHEEPVESALAQDLGGQEVILVVEDEKNVRDLVTFILQEQGYNVLDSSDEPEQLQSVLQRDGTIDLILSDVMMPNQNGPQVVKKVKKVFPDIKVIYMSAYSDDILTNHDLPADEIEFIKKPFTPASLASIVRTVLDKNK